MSEFNLGDWFEGGKPEDNIERWFNEELLNPDLHSREIAYHEAGHFLIDCLVLKEKLEFTEIINAKIWIDDDEAKGGVNKRNDGKRKTQEQIRKFYSENINRIAYKILTLCAGYATYLKFIDKND